MAARSSSPTKIGEARERLLALASLWRRERDAGRIEGLDAALWAAIARYEAECACTEFSQ